MALLSHAFGPRRDDQRIAASRPPHPSPILAGTLRLSFGGVKSNESNRPLKAVNAAGSAHLTFAVEDVEATAKRVIEHGGSPVGDLTDREIPSAGTLAFQYVVDPEGNVIEIQRWSKPD
ncbi:MAG: VOC family protein [Candidatus Bipolaricaulia bacterium]